ncbi:CaiB/BaiF CoA transferase family protein [Lentzea cavernae]|uniref:CoA transferase n=1 Tax=Lentzea cavernae TaxID=2020703 RepID=A0ABQ3MDF4_9PSEU|nr:CoA transferase [Lentzea cavernae]GHH39030.1 CoA transferase [Lentzea cavernae]
MSETSTAHSDGPLTGVKVVDASTILAGPLCCQLLGDYGAEVVKIEHPKRGDGMRGHGPSKDGEPLWWKEISRNKRLVAADLSQADGAELLLRLVETADVLVENFRPGTLERWGIGPEDLWRRNPALIVVRVTGFGQTGPYSSRPGFGTLAEAMSGFAHLTGEASGPPTLPAFGLADSLCGVAAVGATMMALWERDTKSPGVGQVVDMNLLMPLMTAVGPGPTAYDQLGVVEQRRGNRSLNNAPRNTYRTSDGSWVAVSTSAQSIAERVMRLVGHPEVIDEPWFATGGQRALHADLLDGHVSAWIAERTRAEVIEQFTAAGAAVAPVYDAADLVADDHVRATGMLRKVNDDKLGDVLMHDVMWGMSRTPGRIRRTGGDLGADTGPVLKELGYEAAEIEAMRERGVIA